MNPCIIARDGYCAKYNTPLSIATNGYLSTYAIVAFDIGSGVSGLKKINLKDLDEKKKKEVLKREDDEILIIIKTFISKINNL